MVITLSTYISIACNLILAGVIFYLKTRKPAKPPTPEKQLDTSASELLSELMNGGAVVVTSVVDPASIFQWSPKAKR